MSRLRLFSDPHIGLNRTSHTTPASRASLRRAIHFQVIENVLEKTSGGTWRACCLGDLFDEFAVDNQSLVDGMEVYDMCDIVLFGNHDLSNRADKLSSIQVLDLIKTTNLHGSGFDEGRSCTTAIGLPIWWVDHKASQSLFEEALTDAYHRAMPHSILLLHCNYESPYAAQDSTLNLTREQAKNLLEKFDYVFIGHEHAPRNDLDGRLVILGNTHPTSFSDISDKYYWDLIIENGRVTGIEPQQIWCKDDGYLQLDWTELAELVAIGDDVQFVEVVGQADRQHMPTIAKQVADIWGMSERLLMVRNAVVATGAGDAIVLNPTTEYATISSRISSELAGSKLEAIWQEYLSRL